MSEPRITYLPPIAPNPCKCDECWTDKSVKIARRRQLDRQLLLEELAFNADGGYGVTYSRKVGA